MDRNLAAKHERSSLHVDWRFLYRRTNNAFRKLVEFLDNERFIVHALTTSVLGAFTLQLARPSHLFESGPNWRFFLKTWPGTQSGWALLLGVVAIFSFSALLFKDRDCLPTEYTKYGPFLVRRASFVEAYQLACTSVLCGAHIEIARCFWLATDPKTGSHVNTGFTTYSIVSLFSVWVLYRTHKMRGIYET